VAKLTDSQIKALRQMTEHYGTMCVRFQTGESLLKRGLAERYTQCVIAADYVTHKGAHPRVVHHPRRPRRPPGGRTP
jgi:hypothetical protein